MATDSVGNTDTLSDTLRIATDAPDGPVLASYTRDGDGIRGISTEQSDGDLTVSQVNSDGTVTEVLATQVDIDVLGETNFQFQTDVPDGSHLVVNSTDAAGNTILLEGGDVLEVEFTLRATPVGGGAPIDMLFVAVGPGENQGDLQLVSTLGAGSMFSLILPVRYDHERGREQAAENRSRGMLARSERRFSDAPRPGDARSPAARCPRRS